LSECPLCGTFDEIDQRGLTQISQVVFFVDEVITGKKISIVFNHGNITASFLKDTQGMLLAQGCSGRFLEDLDFYLPDILTHPFIEDGAEKSAEGLRGDGTGAYSSIDVRPGFH
jgi:hypothetical protein